MKLNKNVKIIPLLTTTRVNKKGFDDLMKIDSDLGIGNRLKVPLGI